MQEFYIKSGSVLPKLRMELINDGRFDFRRSELFNENIQNADVKFSMKDSETGIMKISNADAEIVLANDEGCEEKYIIQYSWKERDTKKCGIFDAWFDIYFNDLGLLKMPITEDLRIYIK